MMTLTILKTVGSPAPKKSLARRAQREVNHTYAQQGLFHPFSSLGVTAETRLSYGPVRDHRNKLLFAWREKKLDYRYMSRTKKIPSPPPPHFLLLFSLFTVYQDRKCRSWGHMTAVVVPAPTEGRKTQVEILFL